MKAQCGGMSWYDTRDELGHWMEEAQQLLEDANADNSPAAIERLVELLRNITASLPQSDPRRTVFLFNLSNALKNRFMHSGSRRDLDEAVEIGRNSVSAGIADPNRGALLGNLALVLRTRFESFGDDVDLDEALALSREAARNPKDRNHVAVLQTLATVLRTRYSHLGNLADLDEAINTLHRIEGLIPIDDSRLTDAMYDLCETLQDRFRLLGDQVDIDAAVEVGAKAVAATTENHPNRADAWSVFGRALWRRFQRFGSLHDLNRAVDALNTAVRNTSSEVGRAHLLSNLSAALQSRFARLGNPVDLNEAITVSRDEVAILHNDSLAMSNLGSALLARYQSFGDPTDLDEAVNFLRQAVNASPPKDPGSTMYWANLGNALREKYLRFGDLNDLNVAIQAIQAALKNTAEKNLIRAGRQTKLGNMLADRYSRLGQLDDLDGAVDSLREALSHTPTDHPDYPEQLSKSSRVLRMRFEATGDFADLHDAINLSDRAINSMPTNHPGLAYLLLDLGVALQIRFQRLGSTSDLDNAVQAVRRATAITPKDHRQYGTFVGRLGVVLQLRFMQGHDIEDLVAAIELGQRAVAALAKDDPSRAAALNNLSIAYGLRFGQTDNLADLDAAIELGGQAVAVTPYDDPSCANYVANLANRVYERLQHTRDSESLGQALFYLQLAARLPTAPAFVRAMNAQKWGTLATTIGDWLVAKKALSLAIEQLSHLTGRRLTRASRQYYLEELTAIGSQAAAVALNFGEPAEAISLLEQGRGVLLAQMLETRTNEAAQLDEKYAEYARRFRDLGRLLDIETAGLDLDSPDAITEGPPDPERRRRQVAEWDQLLTDIRRLPGFKDFLLAPDITQLLQCAKEGPVVAINVSDLRCDALILSQNGVQTFPLKDLTLKSAMENSDKLSEAVESNSWDTNKKISAVLEWLWDAVTGPVLDYLGYTRPPDAGESWPRLWWMPTGPMSLLPLHASGYHLRSDPYERTVHNRVVSSYTSTLRTLQHARSRGDPDQARLLAVAMTHTPGEQDLRYAADEVAIAIAHLRADATRVTDAEATREAVLTSLRNTNWAHFACHAKSSWPDPSDSHLLLHDGPLRVRDIGGLNLKTAFLAFLSACNTAYSGARLTDEAIHISSAFQLAGYSHVIGTLWPIADEAAREIADRIYACLADHRPANALHDAVGKTRTKYPDSPFLWASHIHIGP
jgi:hypothetical protein